MSGKIGFIGLGAMGQPMAANLARKGFDLTVFDIAQDRVPALKELGATVAGSVAEIAETADIAVTMVPDGPDVEAVVLGPDGLAEAGRAGQLVMDMSTVSPASTDRMAAALAGRDIGFVDAPVGRLVTHAIAGESLFMVGGTAEDVARVRPLLDAMGTTVLHCGPAGAGIRTKLVNNYLIMGINQMNAEALALAQCLDLDLETTLDVLYGTTAVNGQLQVNWPNKVLKDDTDPGFRIALAHKDVSLAVEAAREAGLPVFAGTTVREALATAMAQGYGDRDFSAILDAVCGLGGVTPPRLPR